MSMRARITAVLVTGLAASSAHADHHHMAMDSAEAVEPAPFDASVQLIAASYGTISYVGDYEGVIPSIGWHDARFSVGANLGLYRIMLNGLDASGIGDAMIHAGVTLVHQGDVTAGLVAMVSAPTGDDRFGLGMGHTMVMPSTWGMWSHDRVTVSASAGFSRAIAQMEAGHDHGVWPLVEPMNMSEISWGVGCDVALGSGLRGGVRGGGGIPVGLPGHERVVAALRMGWGSGRVDTAAEVQTGLVGDPYTVRGLVETALHF